MIRASKVLYWTQVFVWLGQGRIFATLSIVLLLSMSDVSAQQGNWTVLDSVETSVFYSFIDLDCTSPLRCAYIADSGGYRSVARVTYDGGSTWLTVAQDDIDFEGGHFPKRYLAVAIPDNHSVVVLVENNLVITTSDSGRTWDSTKIDIPSGRLSTMQFANDMLGFVAGPRHVSYVTHDGGHSWARTDSIADELSIKSLHAAPSGDVFVLLARDSIRRMMVSSDSGISWTRKDVPNWIDDLEFVDRYHGWGVGGISVDETMYALDYIVRTTDGGDSWVDVERSWNVPSYGLGSVSFADSLFGITTGGSGKILGTSDGGRTWHRQSYACDTLENTCNIGKVEYESPDVAYAIGTFARLLKYERASSVGGSAEMGNAPMSQYDYGQVLTENRMIRVPYEFASTLTRFEVFDLAGRCVISVSLTTGIRNLSLPETLPVGSYVVVLSNGGHRYSWTISLRR